MRLGENKNSIEQGASRRLGCVFLGVCVRESPCVPSILPSAVVFFSIMKRSWTIMKLSM